MIELKENQFVVWAKIGDKQTAPGKEHLGIKHLMPVCYYLPEWMAATHKSVEDWFGGYAAGKCFATLILDKTEWLDRIVKACTYPVGDPADKFNYRPRDMVFDVAAVEAVTKDAQILSRWQSPYVVNPVDCCAMTKAAALDATKMTFTSLSAVKDFNAVSSGTYTYGDGTKDYATRALAYADIANLTAALTFGQDVACTESASATITESLGGFTFEDKSNSSHLGNPNAGYKSTLGDIIGISLQQEGPGTTNIHDLYLVRGTTTVARQTIYSVTVTTACTLNIYNNLIDFAGNNAQGINTADADQPANIYNNKIWDNTATNSRAIYLQAPNANTVIENNTCYNGAIGIDAVSSAVTIRNNMTLSCTVGFQNVASATGRNNVDTGTTCENTDFATGSGNVTSATALNEVISVTDTDATFLQVRTDATNANDGGATPGIAGNTTGIEGYARPSIADGTTYSIGASQVKITPSITLPLSPTAGTEAGGTTLTIPGSGYGATQGIGTVTVGGTAAASYSAWGNTQIVIVTPPGTVGFAAVVVTNSDANSDTESNAYEYTSSGAPTVTSCTPSYGTRLGGTSVVIACSNAGATQGTGGVTFGGTVATVTSWSATSITATTPAHAIGYVDVVVTTDTGFSGTLTNGFQYVAIPVISLINPSSVTVLGGVQCMILGSDLGATSNILTFGGVSAQSISYWTDTTIYAVIPAGTGTVDIVVTNVDGYSGTLSGGLTYTSAISITSISPVTGDTIGENTVTILGDNFEATQGSGTVLFGSTAATITTWANGKIVCIAPAGSGATIVTVTNNSAQSATYNCYVYVAATYTDYTTLTYDGITNTQANDAAVQNANDDDVLNGLSDGTKDQNIGALKINTVPHEATDVDKFLVSSSGQVKYRTGTEVVSDIGVAPASAISGTQNYLAKFGATGATVGDSTITDTGSVITLNAGEADVDTHIKWDSGTALFVEGSSGNVGIGTITGLSKLSVNGGVHVGGDSDAGDNNLIVDGTINAANIGADTDNSVVVLNSSGYFKTDEIDSRVWGTSLVDGSGSANCVAIWSDTDTLTSTAALTWQSTNELDINVAENGFVGLEITNVDMGSGAYCGVEVYASGSQLFCQALGAYFTTNKLWAADSACIYSAQSSAGLRVFTSDSSQLILGTNNTANITIASGGATTFNNTINAANIGTGTDNSVVVLDSSGYLRTDEIDPRVWGTTLVDGSGSAGKIPYWTAGSTLGSISTMDYDSVLQRFYIDNDIHFYEDHWFKFGPNDNEGCKFIYNSYYKKMKIEAYSNCDELSIGNVTHKVRLFAGEYIQLDGNDAEAYAFNSADTGKYRFLLVDTDGKLCISSADIDKPNAEYALAGSISGTQNYLAKFGATGATVGDSSIYDNGVEVSFNLPLIMVDYNTIGLGSTGAGRLQFIDNAIDVAAFIDCYVGIGINSPSAPFDINISGGVGVKDFIELTNTTQATAENGHTGILFNLADSSDNVCDAARISVLALDTWTSTASTQDAQMNLGVALNGTITTMISITGSSITIPDGKILYFGTDSDTEMFYDNGAGYFIIDSNVDEMYLQSGSVNIQISNTQININSALADCDTIFYGADYKVCQISGDTNNFSVYNKDGDAMMIFDTDVEYPASSGEYPGRIDIYTDVHVREDTFVKIGPMSEQGGFIEYETAHPYWGDCLKIWTQHTDDNLVLEAVSGGDVWIVTGDSIYLNGDCNIGYDKLTTSPKSVGFFGETPISQWSATGETTGFTAGSGTAVKDDSTFTGNDGSTAYRINDIVKALKGYGLLTA